MLLHASFLFYFILFYLYGGPNCCFFLPAIFQRLTFVHNLDKFCCASRNDRPNKF